MMQGPSSTGLQVTTAFFPLSFFLFFCSPIIVVDGQPYKTSWGTQFFPVAPGQHSVKIFFRYMWMAECGANAMTVAVYPGQITRLSYYMPPFIYAPGSLKQV